MSNTVKRIEELCIKITDGAHYSPEECIDGCYPMYSSKDMLYGKFADSGVKLISEEDYKKLVTQDCQPQENDILIIKDGANYLKYTFRVPQKLNAVILSSIAILRPDINIIDPDYFTYLLRTKSIRSAMANYVSGAAIPRIVLKDFKKMKLSIEPSISVQREISKKLLPLDNLIEVNNKKIELLEKMAESIYKEWFVHFRFPGHETADFENDTPHGWSMGKEVETKRPKNWHYGQFAELGLFVRGRNITSAEMIDGDVPVVSAGIDPSGYHNESNVKGKSLTVSASGANAGFLKYNLDDIWAADCSYYQDEGKLWFAYHLLKFLQPVISNLQCGAAQPHVHPKQINRLSVIIPPESLIRDYCSRVSPMYDEIKKLMDSNRNLNKQRDLLLPRLMSGKLEVQ